jgi:hypothetical protein
MLYDRLSVCRYLNGLLQPVNYDLNIRRRPVWVLFAGWLKRLDRIAGRIVKHQFANHLDR